MKYLLVLSLVLQGCATVNYSYNKNPCKVVSQDSHAVVLICPKVKYEQR